MDRLALEEDPWAKLAFHLEIQRMMRQHPECASGLGALQGHIVAKVKTMGNFQKMMMEKEYKTLFYI